MTAPVFTEIVPRLYALSGSDDSGIEGYWAGFLAGSTDPPPSPASLLQAWENHGGIFLFLNQGPADPTQLVDTLLAALPQLSPRGWLRYLWIDNPADAPWAWRTRCLNAVPVTGSDTWSSVTDTLFPLGDYAIKIAGGAVLTLDLTAGAEGTAISTEAVAFAAIGADYSATADGMIPFAGSGLGCAVFPVGLDHGGMAEDDFSRLGTMLRYTIANADSLTGATDLINMPILAQTDSTPIPASLSFDPINPLIGDRSHLSFEPALSTPPVFAAALKTDVGTATTLTPQVAPPNLAAGRLVFGRSPLFRALSADAAILTYHLSPDGTYLLNASSDQVSPQLMLGGSGAETIDLSADGGCVCAFSGGRPAFVCGNTADPASDGPNDGPLLTGLATTSYLSVYPTGGGAGLTYFAQPLQAPLYVADAVAEGFLDYHQMPAATLPANAGAGDTALPVAALSRISPQIIDSAVLLETSVLAPRRRQVVGLPSAHQSLASADDPLNTAPLAVTSKGLVALLTTNRDQWAGVLFANMPQSEHQLLTLTEVGPVFQSALQSNQLFMVVSNVDTFMSGSSVAYQLTAANGITLMEAAGVPAAVATAVDTALAALQPPYPLFANETDFQAAVAAAAGEWLPQVEAAAGLLRADIEGWNFQLSPRAWRNQETSPTLMIFKYCDRPLSEMANTPDTWGWPEAAADETGDLGPTVRILKAILATAREKAENTDTPEDDPYLVFWHDIASNPYWNGVLFLNAPVDFTQMPQPLQFMAAGVDTSRFYAHHIAFDVTPFEAASGTINLGATAASALIDYTDPDDLVPSATIPYGFKTMQLRVKFDNSRVSDFSAQVELMVNRFFGSWMSKSERARGNNLILDGSYQRVGGAPGYAFALIGDNAFLSDKSALESVGVDAVRLETSATDEAHLAARFVLSGRMSFVAVDGFDLFSFGPDATPADDGWLSFDGLVIGMSFPIATPVEQSFALAEGAISFDTAEGRSPMRLASLGRNFPLQLVGMVASPEDENGGTEGTTPAELGYTSIAAPFSQTPLKAPWYGLVFDLDMGTLGALSGAIGLKISVLAAWAPGDVGGVPPPVFLGLKLGISNALNGSLPVQGVLKLGFRSFQFETFQNSSSETAYLLRMRRFALSALVWSFPPGNADLLLFGAPGAPRTSLGWYAAYSADQESGDSRDSRERIRNRSIGADPARLARAGRRTPPVI